MSLLLDQNVASDPSVLAEEFNQFFINAAPQIVSDIHPCNKSPSEHIQQISNSFSLLNVPVTLTEVRETTRKLHDKKTPDEFVLTSYLLKKLLP